MRTGAILVLILMFAGIMLAVPLQKRTDVISPKDDVEMRMDPIFDPDFHKEHITLFDDYGMKPIPPILPPYILHGQGIYEPNLEEEYY